MLKWDLSKQKILSDGQGGFYIVSQNSFRNNRLVDASWISSEKFILAWKKINVISSIVGNYLNLDVRLHSLIFEQLHILAIVFVYGFCIWTLVFDLWQLTII